MNRSRIEPEKITNPFQLMAAWFTMLVILDGGLLLAASQIKEPKWVSGFLCVGAVVLAGIVMLVVFLMLTRYRPHLQSGKEYSEWLRDQKVYVGNKTHMREAKRDRVPFVEPTEYIDEIREDVDVALLKDIVSYPMKVISIEDSQEVVSVLRRQGFQPEIYVSPSPRHMHDYDVERHEAIWVGSRVPARVVVLAIKKVLQYWKHLKYMHLSEDSDGPDYTHYEVFFGGASSTAEEYGLRPWSSEELLGIDDNMSIEEFHELIRSKYPEK